MKIVCACLNNFFFCYLISVIYYKSFLFILICLYSVALRKGSNPLNGEHELYIKSKATYRLFWRAASDQLCHIECAIINHVQFISLHLNCRRFHFFPSEFNKHLSQGYIIPNRWSQQWSILIDHIKDISMQTIKIESRFKNWKWEYRWNDFNTHHSALHERR